LEQIEAIQREAQKEGFTVGYEEGRKEGREQGYKKGYQEGSQAGFAEGMKAGQTEVQTQVENLSQILGFMSRPLHELDTVVEEELVLLTTAIARQLIRRELKTSPGEIVAVVRQAVSLLPAANQGVCVHLHPADAQLVQEVLAFKNAEQNWRIQEDPTLSRGGCLVDSTLSRIDASVETRLGAVIATVLGDEREQNRNHT
jgi:flagellar assembly protein FliH